MAINTAKVIATCFILSVSMQMCCGSAIPIWEFLTRNEKMSYLYSTFAQLVSVHCKATAATSTLPVNQCKRNLLSYGYEKLQTFSEAQLDALDPYQHAANELIWSSIMRDHPSSILISTRQPLPTPPASSIIILSHQNPTPATSDSSTTNSQQYPKNPLFDTDAEQKHKFAMDMDIAYGYPQQKMHPNPMHTSQVETFEQQALNPQQRNTYLSGPLVFRVRPDGSPVEEDEYKPLPRDDDLETYQLPSTPTATTTNSQNGAGRTNKHRKIATISALKQQHLATLALQQQLQPPLEQQSRTRRQFQVSATSFNPAQQPSAFGGYYYGKSQA